MKQTLYQFGITTLPDRFEALKTVLREHFMKVSGVQDVGIEGEPGLARVDVTVQFSDERDAKRIHRKVSSLLLRTPDLHVVYTRTTLSDIY